MSWATVILMLVVLVVVLFAVLQFFGDRTYKPSVFDVKRIIESSIAGHLDLGTYDQFVCVRIAYDKRLEQIRKSFKYIVDDPQYMSGSITKENATPLNDKGKARLKALLDELERI